MNISNYDTNEKSGQPGILGPVSENEGEFQVVIKEEISLLHQVKLKEGKEKQSPSVYPPMNRKRQKHQVPLSPRDKLKIYTCKDCPAVFSRVTQLKYHARLHLDSQRENLECKGCHIVFSSRTKLLKHKQRKHVQSLTCEICNSSFSQQSSFRLHMRLHSGERPFCCNECDATFVQSSHLSIHKRTHTGEKPYQCDVCKQTFKQISHLRTHERIHTQTKPFRCEYCESAFIQKSSLNRHMRIHTGERPYICTVCPATFCVKNNLNRHMAIHYGNQPFDCELCGAAFGQSVDLKRHKISHTGVKPYRCEECHATFSRNNNLRLHKFTHTGETPFKCEECDCRFMKPRDLKKHAMTHAPPKCYTCPTCQQQFHQSSSLKKHMMVVHTVEKPYSCTDCSAAFVSKNTLKRHMQKHTGSKLFRCKDCNTQFLDIHVLNKHCSENHGEKNEQNNEKEFSEPLENSMQITTIVPENSLPDPVAPIPSHFMAYQVQVQDPTLHSTLPCTVYNTQDSHQPTTLAYSTSNVGLTSLQPFVQAPVSTLMISAGPGQPLRAARPANNCQNHYAHVITMTSNNQLQSWCFCDIPTIPASPLPSASQPEPTLEPPVTHDHSSRPNTQPQEEPSLQPQHQQEYVEKVNGNTEQTWSSGGFNHVEESQQLFVRPIQAPIQSGLDGKSQSQVQFHVYADGQVSSGQSIWINGNWISQK